MEGAGGGGGREGGEGQGEEEGWVEARGGGEGG